MKKNVLLVEDDPALRMVMREVLKEEFEIEEADNGVDGIDKALHAASDLIILDYHLPKKDGLEVIKAIKAANPNIPVIVLTGYLNPDCEEKFNRLGANKIFPKPFNYRSLLETVRSLMRSRQIENKPVMATVEKPFVQAALAPTEKEILTNSLDTIASLAEKVEFLKSVSEKYWIEPNDICSIRETARCMETLLKQYYGTLNNSVFDSGDFSSPLLNPIGKPCLAGDN